MVEVLVRLDRDGDLEVKIGTGDGRHWYLIERYRIDTPDRLVRWLLQLSEKVWFTREHLRQLINLFADQTGFQRRGL